jgi:hypothetical protein
VAAYRADIEIGVKGIGQIGALQKSLNQVSTAVDIFNKKQVSAGFNVQNLLTYNKQLQQATKNILKAAAGSAEELKAVRDLVTAKNNQAAAQQRINRLLAQEDAETASIVRKQEELLSIAARARLAVAAEQRRQAVPEVQRTSISGVAYPQGAAPGEGPSAQRSIEQSTINRVRNVAAAEQTYAEEVFRIKRNFDIQANNTELDFIQAELNAELDKIETVARAQRKADNAALKDFDDRLQQRTEIKGRRKEAVSNAIIGGAFPLLFGQGLGAAIGGGAGGFAGGMMGGQFGFGLSLVGTAIGQAFDTATQSTKDFSKALKDTGDASQVLEASLGGIDKETKTLIGNLARSGQVSAAAEESFKALAAAIGVENAEAFQKAGEATNEWGKNLQTWLTKLYAQSVRLAQFIADNFPTGAGLQQPDIYGMVEGNVPADTLSKEAQTRIQDLSGQNNLLEKQASLARLTADASVEQKLQLERQIALQQYVNEAVSLEGQLKQKLITDQEYNLKLKGIELELTKELFTLENNAQQERKRRAEEARQVEEAAAKARMTAASSLYAAEKDSYNLLYENIELYQGPGAAIKEQLGDLNERRYLDYLILGIEKQQALVEAQKTGTVKEVNDLYDRRLKNLNFQYDTEKARLQIETNRLALQKTLAAQARREDTQGAVDPIRQQQRQVELGIAGFTMPENAVAEQEMLLEQRTRAYETELPILQEINRLTAEVNSGAFNEEALAAKTLDLEAQQSKLALVKEELMLLDQLEQKQLKLQQFFTTYGQLIQSVSGEIANAVTFGVSEMVRGTKTAEQVFADFLQAIGAALLQQAQTMIATYIAIGIARIFAGMGGGGGGGGTSPFAGGAATGGETNAFAYAAGAPQFRADGGSVRASTPYLVGERGPELFVPGTSGGVMSNSDLRASMGAAPGSSGGPVLNMSFETSTINGVEYVSRDQLEAAMAQTRRQAARDGAQRGMSMTLDRLQQSPSTRKRVGF